MNFNKHIFDTQTFEITWWREPSTETLLLKLCAGIFSDISFKKKKSSTCPGDPGPFFIQEPIYITHQLRHDISHSFERTFRTSKRTNTQIWIFTGDGEGLESLKWNKIILISTFYTFINIFGPNYTRSIVNFWLTEIRVVIKLNSISRCHLWFMYSAEIFARFKPLQLQTVSECFGLFHQLGLT